MKKKNKFYAPAGKNVCITLKTLNGDEVRSLLGEHAALYSTLKSAKRDGVFPEWTNILVSISEADGFDFSDQP